MRLVGVVAEAAFAVFFILAVVAIKILDVAIALESEDVRRDAVEEPPIVADHDRAPREAEQRFLQRAQCVDVEIVRRLVEQQDVAAALQQLREMQPVALSTREVPHLLLLIRAASLQFVRKLSGFNAPSKANEAAFDRAIDDVAAIARRLIDSLRTGAAPRNREEVAAAARVRSTERFGRR